MVLDSPYRPGSGQMPPMLAGRSTQLTTVDAMLARVRLTGTATNPVIITGSRGLGKTVILNAAAARASERGGMTVVYLTLDRGSSAPRRIAAETQREAAGVLGSRGGRQWTRLKERFGAFSVQLSVPGVTVTGSTDRQTRADVDRDELTRLLCETAELLRAKGRTGLLLVIDEIQEANEQDTILLANTLQDCVTRGAPIASLAAGLPHTPDALMAAGTFAERFTYQTVDRLTPDESLLALLEPARAREGVLWARESAEVVLARAKGAPYLLQLFGQACWHAAQPTPGSVIAADAAVAGIASAERELWNGMFRGRWAKAGPVERQLLGAVAATIDARGTAHSADIAQHLGRSATQISGVRRRLIDKGLLEATGYARLAFTMPGFEDFVRAEAETELDRPRTAHEARRLTRRRSELLPADTDHDRPTTDDQEVRRE